MYFQLRTSLSLVVNFFAESTSSELYPFEDTRNCHVDASVFSTELQVRLICPFLDLIPNEVICSCLSGVVKIFFFSIFTFPPYSLLFSYIPPSLLRDSPGPDISPHVAVTPPPPPILKPPPFVSQNALCGYLGRTDLLELLSPLSLPSIC